MRCHAGCDQRDVIAALQSAAFGMRAKNAACQAGESCKSYNSEFWLPELDSNQRHFD